jgi:ElaB/YqjD/DUF883 family membrane-anchored ribosome-binding protein
VIGGRAGSTPDVLSAGVTGGSLGSLRFLLDAVSEALREVKVHMNRAQQGLDAGDSGLEAVRAVRDTTASAVRALEDVVHKRPFAALAIATGLGFPFGATWRR